MGEYKIEKGVPVPVRGRGAQYKMYPFEDMEVGDSFTVPIEGGDKMEGERLRMRVCGIGMNWCRTRRPETKIASQKIGDHVRFWLIAKDLKR